MSDKCRDSTDPACKAHIGFHDIMKGAPEEIETQIQHRIDSGQYVCPDLNPNLRDRSLLLLKIALDDPYISMPIPDYLLHSPGMAQYGSIAEKATAHITREEVNLIFPSLYGQ